MKLFRIECFVTESVIHSVALTLASYKAREVQIIPVPNGESPTPPKPTGRPKGRGSIRRSKYGKTGATRITQLVAQGITTWKDLRDHFPEAGRSPGAAPTAITVAQKRGFIMKDPQKPGHYKLGDTKPGDTK